MGDSRYHIKRYLSGKRSFSDTVSVYESMGKGKSDADVDQLNKQMWDDLCEKEQDDNKELKPLFYKIQYLILKEEAERKSKKRKLIIRSMSIAASILIPLSIALFVKYGRGRVDDPRQELVEIFCPPGTRTHFQLPDGSGVWMNGGSEIQYSAHFKDKRQLKLNGEAFFEVVKDPESPFVVSNKNNNIRVLGTRFNVMGYDESKITEVVLVSGKVQLSSEKRNYKRMMFPNQRVLVSETGRVLEQKTVNAKDYVLWKDGVLFFDNEDLDEVAKKIERYYNVDVDLDIKGLEDQRFRAKIPIGNLDELMHYLKLTMPLNYSILEGQKQKNHMISKRLVVIRKRNDNK